MSKPTQMQPYGEECRAPERPLPAAPEEKEKSALKKGTVLLKF